MKIPKYSQFSSKSIEFNILQHPKYFIFWTKRPIANWVGNEKIQLSWKGIVPGWHTSLQMWVPSSFWDSLGRRHFYRLSKAPERWCCPRIQNTLHMDVINKENILMIGRQACRTPSSSGTSSHKLDQRTLRNRCLLPPTTLVSAINPHP